MSVFISIRYPDCIQLLTDGATYNDENIVMGIMRKVWISKHCPFAISGRGDAEMVEKAARAAVAFCDRRRSVEATLEWLDALAAQVLEMRDKLDDERLHFELLVAFYSEAHGFAHAVMCTFEGDGVDPFLWHYQPDVVRAGPDVDPSQIDMKIPPSDPRFLPTHGVEIMEAMRRNPKPDSDAISLSPKGPQFGAVCGGLATLTTIKKSGVVSRNLKIWPDKVGQKVILS